MAATNATTKASTLTQSASTSPTVQQSAASQQQTSQAGSASGTGIFNWQLPNIMPSLDQFLGLPAVIDWQDIGIRVSMVVVGILLLVLVAWSFVREKQTTNVVVQSPQQSGITKETEAAE